MKNERYKDCVNQYKNMIYSQALYFTGNYDDAADITQEVLIKLWNNFDSISRRSLKSWLMKVTKHQCIDEYRKKRDHVLPVIDNSDDENETYIARSDDRINPEEEVMNIDLRENLFKAIQQLPPRVKLAIIMREIHNYSYSEIAHSMDTSLDSVKVSIHRGRKMLFDILKPLYKEGHIHELS